MRFLPSQKSAYLDSYSVYILYEEKYSPELSELNGKIPREFGGVLMKAIVYNKYGPLSSDKALNNSLMDNQCLLHTIHTLRGVGTNCVPQVCGG